MDTELLKRRTIVPGLVGGKPTIRGMGFKVSDVSGYFSAGMNEEDLLNNFSCLEKGDIKACLLYASKKIRSQHNSRKLQCSMAF